MATKRMRLDNGPGDGKFPVSAFSNEGFDMASKVKYSLTFGVGFTKAGQAVLPHEVAALKRWILEQAARKFGGATWGAFVGSYLQGETLVLEPCVTVTIVADDNGDNDKLVDTFAAYAKAALQQDSVLVETAFIDAKFV